MLPRVMRAPPAAISRPSRKRPRARASCAMRGTNRHQIPSSTSSSGGTWPTRRAASFHIVLAKP